MARPCQSHGGHCYQANHKKREVRSLIRSGSMLVPLTRGRIHMVASMSTRKTEKSKPELSERDARLLLLMSADLVALCAKLTTSFDPTAAAMLLYARDEIAPEQRGTLNSRK
jgi:hypothetical protein